MNITVVSAWNPCQDWGIVELQLWASGLSFSWNLFNLAIDLIDCQYEKEEQILRAHVHMLAPDGLLFWAIKQLITWYFSRRIIRSIYSICLVYIECVPTQPTLLIALPSFPTFCVLQTFCKGVKRIKGMKYVKGLGNVQKCAILLWVHISILAIHVAISKSAILDCV